MLQMMIGVLVLMLTTYYYMSRDVSLRAQAKMSILTIYLVGIAMWPFLWSIFFKDHQSSSIASLSWPILILLLEIYLLKYHTFEKHVTRNRSILSMDANMVCSLTFTLSSILGAHKDAYYKNIFLYGVLGCIAFVMFTPQAPTDTIESILIEGLQKLILIYSTGILLGGSMLLMKNENVVTK